MTAGRKRPLSPERERLIDACALGPGRCQGIASIPCHDARPGRSCAGSCPVGAHFCVTVRERGPQNEPSSRLGSIGTSVDGRGRG
jgi:hypothetical protein